MDEQALHAAAYLSDLAYDWTVNRPARDVDQIHQALASRRFTSAERQRVARFVASLATACQTAKRA